MWEPVVQSVLMRPFSPVHFCTARSGPCWSRHTLWICFLSVQGLRVSDSVTRDRSDADQTPTDLWHAPAVFRPSVFASLWRHINTSSRTSSGPEAGQLVGCCLYQSHMTCDLCPGFKHIADSLTYKTDKTLVLSYLNDIINTETKTGPGQSQRYLHYQPWKQRSVDLSQLQIYCLWLVGPFGWQPMGPLL